MIEDIKKDAAGRMQKSVAALTTSMAKIRAGRAHTSLLDHVVVPYYGSYNYSFLSINSVYQL